MARRPSLLLAALLALLALTPGPTAADAQNRAGALLPAAQHCAPATAAESSCTRPGSIPSWPQIAAGCCVATKEARGGAGSVRVGQAGEDAVRGAYNIGEKTPIRVNGRRRVPDGLTDSTLSEVKNVGSLSYTRQLRDFEEYAWQSGRTFDLFVRPGARLSGPLRDADAAGRINIRGIP